MRKIRYNGMGVFAGEMKREHKRVDNISVEGKSNRGKPKHKLKDAIYPDIIVWKFDENDQLWHI